jgi:uncharacterized iron-regulated membrane protein
MSFLDNPQTRPWRKALLQVHLWAGFVVGLYVLAVSLSGSILVFHRELVNDTPALTASETTPTVDYDEIIAIATRAHQSERFEAIDLRTRRRRVISVILTGASGERTVYVDSVTKEILRDVVTREAHPFVNFLLSLHTELLAGRTGAIANGIGGLSFFLLALTGMILWWPGRRRWKRSLTVNWHANWARLNWDIHSAFGFWSVLFVAMWALTGAYFIWPQEVRNAVARLSPMPHFREQPSNWRPGDPVLTANAFIAHAQERYPKSQLAYFYESLDHAGGVVKVFLSPNPTQSLTLSEDVVTFQPATGEVLSDISTSNLTRTERLSLALYSIHYGDFAGLAGKFVWCVLGLIPSLLTLTGLIMWWNRSDRKKAWAVFRTHQTNRYRHELTLR